MKTAASILDDYYAEVAITAQALTPKRRADLLAGIAEHLREACAAGEADDEMAARAMIARLGDPETIVRAAGLPCAPNGVLRSLKPSREFVAFFLLTVGSFLPILGWLLGVRVLWDSHRLNRRDKLVATCLIPGGPFIACVFTFGWLADKMRVFCDQSVGGTLDGLNGPVTSVVETAKTCTQPELTPWLGITVVLALLIASVAGPARAWRKARRYAA